MTSIIAVTDGAFDKEVLKSDKPVIVDFWAEWCGPCKQFGPVFEDVSNNVGGVVFAKVNIDENPQTPQQYGVRGIPTLLIFEAGQIKAEKIGAAPKAKLAEWIEENI